MASLGDLDTSLLAAALTSGLLTDSRMKKLSKNRKFKSAPEWKAFHENCTDSFLLHIKRVCACEAEEPVVLFMAHARDTFSKWTREQWEPVIALFIVKNSSTLLTKAFEMFRATLRCLPHLEELVDDCFDHMKETEVVPSLDLLHVLRDYYGLIYRNHHWGYFLELRKLEHMKYVYESGNADCKKTMFLNHIDANAVLKMAWHEAIEYVIYQHHAKPKPINAAEWFNEKLDREEKSYFEVLPCIKELLHRGIFELRRADLEQITPPAVRNNIFLADCVPEGYFEQQSNARTGELALETLSDQMGTLHVAQREGEPHM